MTAEQIYNRKEFVVGVRAGVSAFARDTHLVKSENRHIDSCYVEHWHESDWMELPENVKTQISIWVDEYRSTVRSFEATAVHTPHMAQYCMQLLEDICHELIQRHVIM